MTDLERFIAAADALAEAADEVAGTDQAGWAAWRKYTETREEYRAARDALTKGTPPAYATSA